MDKRIKKQFALYVLGQRNLPSHTPRHIVRVANASKTLFECLNDNTKTLNEVFKAIEEKHLAARDFYMAEDVRWPL